MLRYSILTAGLFLHERKKHYIHLNEKDGQDRRIFNVAYSNFVKVIICLHTYINLHRYNLNCKLEINCIVDYNLQKKINLATRP